VPPFNTQVNASEVGVGVRGVVVAVTANAIVTVALSVGLEPYANRNVTLLVPAVAPAQPATAFTVNVTPAVWLAVVNDAVVGVTTMPGGKVPRETGIAAPPAAIVVAGFTTTVTAVPGPDKLLQVKLIDAGNAVTCACAPPVVNKARSTNIHTGQEGVHKASTLKRRIIFNGILIDNILFVDIDSAPSSRKRPMFHCHREPYRRAGIEHEECFSPSRSCFVTLKRKKRNGAI